MGLRRLCAGSAIRQAVRFAARPTHRSLPPAALLQDAETADPNAERSNSTYSTSTSSPSLKTSPRILGSEPSTPLTAQRAQRFSSHDHSQLSRSLLHKPSRSALSFRQPGASFATSAFLGGPSPSLSAPAPPDQIDSVTGLGSSSANQAEEVSKQRPAFKRRADAKGVPADTSTGARQLATNAAAQARLQEAAVSSGSVDQGVGTPARALPPLPPRKKTKALRKTAQHIMNILDQEAVAEFKQKKNYPDFRPGDVLELDLIVPENRRRKAVVRGLCLAKRNRGVGSTFVIRRVIAGEGMEYTYPLYSPNIQEIKIIERRPVRRAKLFYLRDWNPRECTV